MTTTYSELAVGRSRKKAISPTVLRRIFLIAVNLPFVNNSLFTVNSAVPNMANNLMLPLTQTC